MSKKIDMIGQRFGALVVTGEAPKQNGRSMVRCVCDCGREVVVNASNLRRGLTTSCGCAAARAAKRRGKPNGQHDDIAGQTFGELTAVEFIRSDLWLFRCSCGRTKAIRASAVKNGSVISCGHILAETATRKIIEQNTPGFYDGTAVSKLRAAVSGQTKARPVNATGHVGVTVVRRASGVRYKARLTLRGKEISLGTYATLDEAVAARKAGEQKYYSPIIEAFCKQEGNSDG